MSLHHVSPQGSVISSPSIHRKNITYYSTTKTPRGSEGSYRNTHLLSRQQRVALEFAGLDDNSVGHGESIIRLLVTVIKFSVSWATFAIIRLVERKRKDDKTVVDDELPSKKAL